MTSVEIKKFNTVHPTPYIVEEGVFGATVQRGQETLFLRMELLTPENSPGWHRYTQMSCWVANNSRGMLSGLVRIARKEGPLKYEEIKESTGFTEREYSDFLEKAFALKTKTVEVLTANSAGAGFMITGYYPGEPHYIVYITKNPHFSIQKTNHPEREFTLKNFIESYNDILISVGSNFSSKDYFHTRGISRNPYWVFEEKYAGLSMLLHGFTGAVAEQYFPEKKEMVVRPIGSMQVLIKKSLLPGEGYMDRCSQEPLDITKLTISPDDIERGLDHIKTSALTRIYYAAAANLPVEKEPTDVSSADFWILAGQISILSLGVIATFAQWE